MSDKELIKHCSEENSLSYNQLKEMDQKDVSGKGFSFHTKELTFNVNDTIVIEGDLVYPKIILH